MSSYQEWQEWKARFLARHGLSMPDGRPLYKYLITKAEFKSLKEIVTNSVPALSGGNIYRDKYDRDDFSGLFVLYASEFFRQKYSGIEWFPVLHSIGINLSSNPYQNLYKCIKKGLSEWDRKVDQSISDARGKKWLGSLIFEGGLPLPLLTDKDCHLGNYLDDFIKKSEYRRSAAEDIAKTIELSKEKLPNTYQNETFYNLLGELIWTVLSLKVKAGITKSDNIIGQLDAYSEQWRDDFPLRVDDDQTTALIETLVKEAIKIPRVFQFPVVRELQKFDDDWQLKSSVTIPETLEISSLHSAFFATDDTPPDFPRRLELSLNHNNRSCLLRRIFGNKSYRPTHNKYWELFGSDAVAEHLLRLKSSEGQVWSTAATKGETLDPDLPWIFEVDEDVVRFIRQGSGSIAATVGIVALPENWNAGDALLPVGKLLSLHRSVYQFSGDIRFDDGEGSSFRIRTGRANVTDESYSWQGNRVWLEFLSPSLAYRGKPTLYTMDDHGNRKFFGRPEWRQLNGKTLTDIVPLGPVLSIFSDFGEVSYRSKMVILPPSANINYEFVDAQTGKVWLEQWGAARVYTKSIDIAVSSIMKNDALEITLKYCGSKYPPEHIELEVEWEHSASTVLVRLPFPLRGARGFDYLGRSIENRANIAVQQLAGVRILALNGSQGNHPHLELEFRLGKISIFPVSATIDGLQAELRLMDYSEEISRLLSTDDRPDAAVEVVLRINGKQELNFRIPRYDCRFEKDEANVRLCQNSLANLEMEVLATLPVLAIPLDRLSNDPLKLQPILSQGVATGVWLFDFSVREPGTWLIYPAIDSQIIFQSVIWHVPGDVETSYSLAQVLGIDDYERRQDALDEVIAVLVENYNHSAWSEIEQVVQKLGHLPLTFLDIWRHFFVTPAGMAALALRKGNLPDDFISRFDKELPFTWETVPYTAWVNAISLLKNQCKIYGENTGETIFNVHLKARIEKITSEYPALNMLLQIARSNAIKGSLTEFDLLKTLGSQWIAQKLFSGEDCGLQKLRQKNSERKEWPEDFIESIKEFRSASSHGDLLCQEQLGHQDSVINYPILLAYQVATDEWSEPTRRIYAQQVHKSFDEDWFNEAYDRTIARCLADGLIKFEESK